MKKLLAIILAAGIFSAGFTGVFAEESTYLTPGNEKDYKWTKIYATEFNAAKALGRDENGNVTLDGEIAPTQNYPGSIGNFDGFQSADGVIYFNPGMLENGKKLVKTEKGLTGYKSGENGYIMDTAILMASSDATKNGGGSLLPTLGDGEWYKVTVDVAVGGADLEGHEIPVTVSSTNKLDWADAFVAQWGKINRLSQNVKISTAKDAAELKDEDFTTLTYYLNWWNAGADDWMPKNIGIGVVQRENPTKADGSIPKEYGEAYFNENGDYFTTLRRVMIEKGVKLSESSETLANAANINKSYDALNAFTHNGAGDNNYGNIVVAPYSESGWPDQSGDTKVGYVDIMKLGDNTENFGFFILNMSGTDSEGNPIYNKLAASDYGGTAILKFGFDVFGFASNTDVNVSVETITGVDIKQNMQIRGESAVGMANKKTYTINGKTDYGSRDYWSSIEYSHDINEKTKDVIGYKITVDADSLFNEDTGEWAKLYINSDNTSSLNACLRGDYTNISLRVKKPATADFSPKLEKIDDGYMAYAPYCKDENAKTVFAVYGGENKLDRVFAGAPNRYFKDDKYEKGQPAKLFIWNGFDVLSPVAPAADVK